MKFLCLIGMLPLICMASQLSIDIEIFYIWGSLALRVDTLNPDGLVVRIVSIIFFKETTNTPGFSVSKCI